MIKLHTFGHSDMFNLCFKSHLKRLKTSGRCSSHWHTYRRRESVTYLRPAVFRTCSGPRWPKPSFHPSARLLPSFTLTFALCRLSAWARSREKPFYRLVLRITLSFYLSVLNSRVSFTLSDVPFSAVNWGWPKKKKKVCSETRVKTFLLCYSCHHSQ